jgi:hypothetical protein
VLAHAIGGTANGAADNKTTGKSMIWNSA